VQRIAERERVPVRGEGSHLNFTCRCSFLQIYAEKISDLLHDLPSGRDQPLALLSSSGPGQAVQVKDLTEHLVLNGTAAHPAMQLSVQ
jgi:Kinesin motor domain